MDESLRELINKCGGAVFFGGAGVSTESGIPDFRSEDGLYNTKYKYPPETMVSHNFFMQHTEEFFEFYREKLVHLDAKPNAAHYALARLEDEGRLLGIVTQNIDGLHQMAGSRNVVELHGSVLRNHCVKCGAAYGVDTVMAVKGIPRCLCGGVIKPDVVLYDESLDEHDISRAIKLIRRAELLIVGGTSLAVYPAAGLLEYFRGSELVLINRTETPYDGHAGHVFRGNIAEVLGE